jgi:rod shape-determining protein MreC
MGAVVAALLGLAYTTARHRPEVTLLERTLRDALAPVQYGVSQTFYRLREAVRTVGAIRRAQQENRQLRQVIVRLRTENASLEEARRENERWRRLLGFVHQSPVRMVPAQVIGRDPTNWFGYVTLNKGSRHGLRANLPVVTEQGVVGMTRQVTSSTTSVLLLLDSRSAIGGQVAETRDYVLVEGSAARDGTAVVKPLAPEIRLRPGHTIITSGLGQVFPKGLAVGRIERVIKGKYGLAPYGILRPAVNFGRLEEVAVLTGGLPQAIPGPAEREEATPVAP